MGTEDWIDSGAEGERRGLQLLARVDDEIERSRKVDWSDEAPV
jgi:hypothetical protein